MKKVFLAAFVFILTNATLRSQNVEITGKPIIEIFTDFHFNLARDTNNKTGFALNRAYFGYNYLLDQNFSATLIVDIGTPEDLAEGSKARRYAHFREASIGYSSGKFNLAFGITGTRLFSYQQKFWGKRYLAKPYQSINDYGYVADLGLVADYKINEIFDFDLTIMNGEGYSNIQLDNDLKSSVGITITPVEQVAIRAYTDIIKTQDLWQTTMVGFAGFKNEKVTIGAEISYKSNLDFIEGHHAWGLSGTGAVSLTKKMEFFTRFDYSTSVIVPGDATQWNLTKDGRFLITGFQYTFNKIVKIALDYQATFPTDKTRPFSDLIFINALLKF
jgi:hypothetical protein